MIAFTVLRYKKLKAEHVNAQAKQSVTKQSLLLEAWKPVSIGYKRRYKLIVAIRYYWLMKKNMTCLLFFLLSFLNVMDCDPNHIRLFMFLHNRLLMWLCVRGIWIMCNSIPVFGRWWDCIALPEDVDPSDEEAFRMQFKNLACTVCVPFLSIYRLKIQFLCREHNRSCISFETWLFC